MSKIFAGTAVTRSVRIVDDAGSAADPTSLVYEYRISPHGADKQLPVVKTATGNYSASFTPDCAGNVYGRWIASGNIERTIPDSFSVYPLFPGQKRQR